MILTAENGTRYRLDIQAEEHFKNVYSDCIVLEDDTTAREHYIKVLQETAGRCCHNLDEEEAESIFEEIRESIDDLNELKSWSDVDFIATIKDYYDEEYYDPSMVDWKAS